MSERFAQPDRGSNSAQWQQYCYRFDSPPPKIFCLPGWEKEDLNCRESARVAADYWDEVGDLQAAKWLRDWASLSPDDHERHRRKKPSSISGPTKWAKSRRSRIERAACRFNPDVGHGYGLRGIW